MNLGLILSWLSVWFLGYLTSLLIFKKLDSSFRLILSFGLGFGIISVIMAVLGLLYNFQPMSVAITLILLYAVLLFLNRKNLKIKLQLGRINSQLLIIIVPFIIISLLHILLFPELYQDSTIYAQWTKILYEDKKINFIEGGPTIGMGFAVNYPSAYQLIGAFIYLFAGESWLYLRFTSLLLSLLLLLLVYKWSEEFFKEKKLALYSVILFISLPLIVFFSRSAAQYIYLAFQFSMACYFLQKFLSENDKRYLYAGSIFGGFAALTTYLGVLFAPLLLLAIQTSKKFYSEIIISFILFSLVISPWYLRNLIVLGNPFWPTGGGKYIDPYIQANSLDQLNKISKMSGFNYDSFADLKNSFGRLLFSYLDYSDASIYNGLNPIFILLAIPAILFWVKNKDKNMYFFVVWFLVILSFYMILLNYWNRYLILISIPTVFLSVYLIKYLQKFKVLKWLVTGFFVFLYLNSLYLALFWDTCPEGKDDFSEVLKNLGDYQKISEICHGDDLKLSKWVNENLPDDVFIATTDYKLYNYDKPVIEFTSWKLRGLHYSSNIDESVEILKENGVTHLVATGAVEDIEIYPEHFELLKEFDGKAIYKIV